MSGTPLSWLAELTKTSIFVSLLRYSHLSGRTKKICSLLHSVERSRSGLCGWRSTDSPYSVGSGHHHRPTSSYRQCDLAQNKGQDLAVNFFWPDRQFGGRLHRLELCTELNTAGYFFFSPRRAWVVFFLPRAPIGVVRGKKKAAPITVLHHIFQPPKTLAIPHAGYVHQLARAVVSFCLSSLVSLCAGISSGCSYCNCGIVHSAERHRSVPDCQP